MNTAESETAAVSAPRRHPAGADPAMRARILDGASKVFLETGFDAASMNDICRTAAVSKSTLYVYFTDKEALFEALVEQERERLFKDSDHWLEDDAPLEQKLVRYASYLAGILCSDAVIRTQRTIVALSERKPELSVRFYEGGAGRAQRPLLRLLEREVAEGTLAIPDIALAASQLIELSTAGLWRQRLFGKLPAPPDPALLAANVRSAVDMFLAAYRRG